MQKLRGTAVIVFSLLLTGCAGVRHRPRATSASIAATSVESRYIEGYSVSHPKPVAVVFVHGLFGNDITWGKGDLTLPHLLATDPDLQQQLDFFLFEYESPILRDAHKIPSLAEQLSGALDDNHVWANHQKVIFVAHSMGGLIVRQYLIAHREHIQKVQVMYFYAVPTNGAKAAKVATRVSNNPQLSGMVPLEGNNFLDAVNSAWLDSKVLRELPTYCAFENQDTYGIRIVTESSALYLCTETPQPLNGNHLQIVKPSDRGDPRFTRLATAIKDSLQAGLSASVLTLHPPKPLTSSVFDDTVAKWLIENDPYALTLHDLFLTDFSSVQQREMGAIFVDDAQKISVQYSIDVELAARSKFLAFYVPANEQHTPEICAYLAKQFQFVLDHAPAQLLVTQKGVGDSGTISTKEAVFTKRIYVYHETFLDSETTIGLAKLFEQQGASVILRSIDYASTKRLEYKVRQQDKVKREASR